MSAESYKDSVRRLIEEVFNRGKLNTLDAVFSTDFISHEELPPGIPNGLEGAKQLFYMLRSAFPDLHASIEDEITEGDRIAVRLTFSATHQGEFMGIAPTGRKVQYNVIDIFRIENGKVVEHWGIADGLSLMKQLTADSLEMNRSK